MKCINKIRTYFFVFFLLFANPIYIVSQRTDLPFFDLSKECNLDIIVSKLQDSGFEEEIEENKSNIPGKFYTLSGDNQYVRFNCNYNPKTKQVASYWYRIYGGNSNSILNELKSINGEPNSDSEYHAPNSFEWHSCSADIKLTIGYDNWIDYSYEDKILNKQLIKDIGQNMSSGELYAILYLIGLCLLVIVFAYVFFKHKKKKRVQLELNEMKRKEEQNKIDSLNEVFKNDLTNKYGKPTRTVDFLYNNDGVKQHNDILVFQKQKIIIIDKKEYDFGDILSCSILDEHIEDTPIYQVTRTKTSSMLGRAAIGALTLGVAGAVVGAVTAKKETISTKSDTSHLESYIVKIGIRSIKEPSITLKYGNNKAKAEETYALIQAIIAMK